MKNINTNTVALLNAVDTAKTMATFKQEVASYTVSNLTHEMICTIEQNLIKDTESMLANIDTMFDKLPEELQVSETELLAIYKAGTYTGKVPEYVYNTLRLYDRIGQLEVILNLKNFKSKLHTILTDLLELQVQANDGTVVVQSILKRINTVLGIKDNKAVMQLLTSLHNIGILTMSTKQSSTQAKTHTIRLNGLTDISELDASWANVYTKPVKLDQPKTMDMLGNHKLVSTVNWRYAQNVYSPEVLEFMNIQNSVHLQIEAQTQELAVAFNKAKYALKSGQTTLVWQDKCTHKAVQEIEEIQVINDGKFYITHFFDGAGRTYENSASWGVQQASSIRHLVTLANKIYLTAEGREEVELHIACLMGYDKATREEALEAFKLEGNKWYNSKKVAHLFQALKDGLTGVLIEQDATNSGTQMYSISSGTEMEAMLCGIIQGVRKDAYKSLANLLNTMLSDVLTQECNLFTRKNVKSLFMTRLYNAGKAKLLFGDGIDETREEDKFQPLMVTLKDVDVSPDVVWDIFNNSMWELAPNLMKLMQQINKATTKGKNSYTWYMPDNFMAQVVVTKNEEEVVVWSDNAGYRHQLTIHTTVLDTSEDCHASSIPARIVQSMDAYLLREVVRRGHALSIDIVTVHDAFMCHPNHASAVRKLYREVMADMMEMNLMGNILSQISNGKVVSTPVGEFTPADVRNSDYSLWA